MNLDLTQFVNLGASGIAVVVIWLVVQRFLRFIENQENNFQRTINNHLKENAEANRGLSATIRELLDYLKSRNGHK